MRAYGIDADSENPGAVRVTLECGHTAAVWERDMFLLTTCDTCPLEDGYKPARRVLSRTVTVLGGAK